MESRRNIGMALLMAASISMVFALCALQVLIHKRPRLDGSSRVFQWKDVSKERRIAPGVNRTPEKELRRRNDSFSMVVTEDDIEKMSMRLPATLKDYKNPCWMERIPDNYTPFEDNLYYKFHRKHSWFMSHVPWDGLVSLMQKVAARRARERLAWRIRCFPYFFLLGFTKCGTTDMHHTLTSLPGFFRAALKEPEFWNNVRLVLNHRTGEKRIRNPRLADYLDLFDMAAEGMRRYTVRTVSHKIYHPGITGDFDPQTIWRTALWRRIKGNENRKEPKYLTPHHLRHLNPRIKFLVLLRNPVERTISHYKCFAKQLNYSVEAGVFHKRMLKIIGELTSCFQAFSIRSCIYEALRARGHHVPSRRSVVGSVYEVFVKDWLDVFPRDQFLFLKAEDYFTNRTSVVEEIIKFLNHETFIPSNVISKLDSQPVINRSVNVTVWNITRKLLQHFYKSFNEKLSALLGSEKWLW